MATSIEKRIQQVRNRDRRCDHPGCQIQTARFGSFCEMHLTRHTSHGTSFGTYIRYPDLRNWSGPVEGVLSRNGDHPSIQAALRWLEALQGEALRRREGGDKSRFYGLLAAQHDRGVLPLDLLRVSAVFHLLIREKLFIPQSVRHEHFQFTRAFFSVWPGGGGRPFSTIPANTKVTTSETISRGIGPVLGMIAKKASDDLAGPDADERLRPNAPLT